MYSFLKSTHSYFAWVVLAVIVWVVIFSLYNVLVKKEAFKIQHYKWVLFAMIGAHVQLVLGLVLYFVSPLGFTNLSGQTMKDSFQRLMAVEHPLTNIIAIVLITVGFSLYKRNRETLHGTRKVAVYMGLGLLLLLSRIPWSTWL
jgi:hypothetical protein